jgi:3D (Asp-Asp-Asp) domain-containing protein
MHVYVDYATRIELILGETKTPIFTQAKTVGEALSAAGYELLPQDVVFPSRTKTVEQGMVVGLSMVRDVTKVEDQPIPFDTVYRYDASVAAGEQLLERAGSDGYWRREYKVKQMNGKETSRLLVSENVVWPTNAVVIIGTKSAANTPAQAAVTGPDPASECPVRQVVWATYYTAISAGGNGITATGTAVYKGIIAVDPAYIPLGTKMYVPGYGYGIAADTGGGVRGWHIDLGYGPSDVYDWGSRYVEICIY